ncbi:hypothetical protein ACO0QE_003821 [Hanseniaspora vineae]
MSSLKRKLSTDVETALTSKKLSNTEQLQQLSNGRETTTVLVRNLPKSTNISQIKHYFADCGTVIYVEFVKTLQVAKIQFAAYEDALSALTRTSKIFNLRDPINGKGNQISVEWYRNSTIWCTNYPPSYSIPDLKRLFEEAGGQVLNIRTPSLRYNANRRFAYVDLTNAEDAASCVFKLDGKTLGSSYSFVAKLSDPSSKTKRTDQSLLDGRELLLKNIDGVDVPNLKAYLTTWGGEIERFTIPKNNQSIAWCSFTLSRDMQRLLSKSVTVKFGDKIVYLQKADKKAYLERQQVKEVMNLRKSDPLYGVFLSLFPLSDKYNKEKVKSLVLSRTSLSESDISSILLVSDHEGALIQFFDASKCSKTMLELQGKNLNKNVLLKCADIEALKKHRPNNKDRANFKEQQVEQEHAKEDDHVIGEKTNSDFKSILYR